MQTFHLVGMRRFAMAGAASVLAMTLGAPSALAAPLTLCGDFICVGISDWGTFGQGDGNPVGIQYDTTGTGAFPTPDYLTPGIPFDGFSVHYDGAFVTNNNNIGSGRHIPGVLVDQSGNGADYRAVWSGLYSPGGIDTFTIERDFSFNARDKIVTIATTITAERDLTNVLFSHQIDPDANAESATNNRRGAGNIAPEDIVISVAPVSGYVLGFQTSDTLTHNTGITLPWSSNPESYLLGTDHGDGDKAIGIGFAIGAMLMGESVTFIYTMLFADSIDDIGTNPKTIAERGKSTQQAQIGSAIDSLGAGNPLHDAVEQLPDGDLPDALQQLSGELHASAQTTILDGTRYVRTITVNRTRSGFGNQGSGAFQALSYAPEQQLLQTRNYGISFWGQGYGSWGHTGSGAAKLDHSIGGFILGADVALNEYWRIGAAGGYSSTSLDQKRLTSSADVGTYQATLYSGLQWGGFGLRIGGSYAWHELNTRRDVNFVGFTDRLNAGYDARSWQVFGEAGYTVDLGTVAFEPYAGISHLNLDIDSFTERGGIASLTSQSTSENTTFTTLGLRAAVGLPVMPSTPLTLHGSLAWQHAFGDRKPGFITAFDGSTPFTVNAPAAPRDTVLMDVGIDMDITGSATLGVSYSGQVGSRFQDHGVKGNFTVRF